MLTMHNKYNDRENIQGNIIQHNFVNKHVL